MIKNLGNRMEKIQETFNKQLEELKKIGRASWQGKSVDLGGRRIIKKKLRWQKKVPQMKEQSKNPPDLTNEEEIGSLPEKEFRIMIVKMIKNLGNRMKKI